MAPRSRALPKAPGRSARTLTLGESMAESVYKVIELVGTSSESWERAAVAAVEKAAQTLEDLRIAEIVEQDLQLEGGKVRAYRVKMKVSFRYKGD